MSSSTAHPNPGRIFEVMRAFQESAALKAGIDLGVFSALSGGPLTASEIAKKCQASERGIRMLCDTLVTVDLLRKENAGYANTPDSAVFLDKSSPAYLGSVAEFLFAPELATGIIQTMTDCVRTGGTMMPGDGTVDPENPIWVKFAEGMAPMMYPSSLAIAAQFPESGPLKVLDIAAGHGIFGIGIAKRNPEAQIVALDWKAVLEVAKRNATAAGVIDRYDTIPGSAFDVDFGSGYDAILLTNFLHHFNPEVNEGLLRKVHAALKPGGRAVTLEFVPNEDRTAPVNAVRFALTMLTSTREGDAYTFSELSRMAANAGFRESVEIQLQTMQSVIISTK